MGSLALDVSQQVLHGGPRRPGGTLLFVKIEISNPPTIISSQIFIWSVRNYFPGGFMQVLSENEINMVAAAWAMVFGAIGGYIAACK